MHLTMSMPEANPGLEAVTGVGVRIRVEIVGGTCQKPGLRVRRGRVSVQDSAGAVEAGGTTVETRGAAVEITGAPEAPGAAGPGAGAAGAAEAGGRVHETFYHLPEKPDTCYYFLGRFEKPQRAQRDAERHNNPLRSSASSVVNLFCHEPLNPEEIKKSRKPQSDIERNNDSLCALPPALLRRPRPLWLIFFIVTRVIRNKLKSPGCMTGKVAS